MVKRSRLSKSDGKSRKQRLKRFLIVRLPEEQLVGKIDITKSLFEDVKMSGVLHHKMGDLFFSGTWDEGFFNIDKTEGGVKLSGEAQTALEQFISDNFAGVYTDGGF